MADFVISGKVVGVVPKTRRSGEAIPNAYQVSLVQVQGDPLGDKSELPKVGFWSADQNGVPNPGFEVVKQAQGSERRVVIEGYTQESSNYGRTTIYYNGQAARWADGVVEPTSPMQGAASSNGHGSWADNPAQRAYFSVMDELPVGREHLIEAKWALGTVLQVAAQSDGISEAVSKRIPGWAYERAAELIAIARTLAVEMAARDMGDQQQGAGPSGSTGSGDWPEAAGQTDPAPEPERQDA